MNRLGVITFFILAVVLGFLAFVVPVTQAVPLADGAFVLAVIVFLVFFIREIGAHIDEESRQAVDQIIADWEAGEDRTDLNESEAKSQEKSMRSGAAEFDGRQEEQSSSEPRGFDRH